MTAVMSANPSVYHITHVENLSAIVAEGYLLSDKIMIDEARTKAGIGMTSIKKRRLELPVTCHSLLMVGECVPFYFCPRSIMLYVIHRADAPELHYRGGQRPIVHLQFDVNGLIKWSEENGVRWAFSLSNAGAVYAEFCNEVTDLTRLDWDGIHSTNFAPGSVTPAGHAVKECKQSEFLVEACVPWKLVQHIGVYSASELDAAKRAIAAAEHQPTVGVERNWYF
jgi:hypothetical protein